LKKAKFFLICLGMLIVSFMMNQNAQAQQYEVGFGLGGAAYTGDIIRRLDPTQPGIQGTLFGRRNFDNVWSVRGGFAFARLNAADSVRPIDAMAFERDAYFRGSAFEAHVMMEYYFLDYLNPQSTIRFSPFAMFGLGYTFFTGRGNGGPASEGGYQLGTPVIPFGLGVKYKLKDRLFMTLEFGARATFTDYLDRIDHNGMQYSRFDTAGNPDPQALTFGDRDNKDWYYFLGLTLSYSFHQVKCFNY
jgi:hypothetical protein